jgi:trimeric autotransporter adhesin
MPTTGTIETATNIIQLVGGQIAKNYGGPMGQAAASLLLGQPGLLASTADLLSKLENGTATGNDVADVLQDIASVLAGVGVLAGLANPAVLTALGIAGAVKFMAQNYPTIIDRLNDVEDAIRIGDPNWAPPIIIDPQSAIDAGLLDPQTLLPRINPSTNSSWRNATNPPRRDPLAIDLDGDGIETVGIPTNGTSPILFDHNADGIRTGTGWVKADDAWLVLDRDGNGSIDSGRELFGVDTIVPVQEFVGTDSLGQPIFRTSSRNARDGFEALRSLDTGSGAIGSAGHGDGVFNASDAAFTQVRLWQDANQDGVSQASEMRSLAEMGVVSIALTPTNTTRDLGNGNTLTGTATVTRSNGSTTQAGGVDLAVGNLNLADNPFYREFSDHIAHTDTARSLPEMSGSGLVRDLREAMSLTNSAGANLVAAVQAFAAGTTRDAQIAALDAMVSAWGGTSTHPTSLQSDTREARYNDNSTETAVAEWARLNPELYIKVEALERFNGSNLLSLFVQPILSWFSYYDQSSGRWNSGWTSVGNTVQLTPEQISLVDQAYFALQESVYETLAVQTRLRPYLDTIDLVIDENGIRFDLTDLNALLDSKHAADPRNALIDLTELTKFTHASLHAVEFDNLGKLRAWISELAADSPVRTELTALGVLLPGATMGTARDNIFLGDAASNTFSAGNGNDIVDGGAGGDALFGSTGRDTLLGGAGDDWLYSHSTGSNFNLLDFVAGAGNADVYEGGLGYDTIEDYDSFDGEGDTYYYSLGDGNDNIRDWGGNADRIVLGAGIEPSAVVVRTDGSALTLTMAASGHTITLNGMYNYGERQALLTIEEILFADGTVWREADYRALAITGTVGSDRIVGFSTDDRVNVGTGADFLNGFGGNDVLIGDEGNDTVFGGWGDDSIYGDDGDDSLNGDSDLWESASSNDLVLGGAGRDTIIGSYGDDTLVGDSGYDSIFGGADNDVILGGDENDYLNGGLGDDTLDGGLGDDTLFGEYGNDTFIFGRGDGIDIVYNSESQIDTVVTLNILRFKAGVLPNDVKATRESNVLVLSIVGTTDKVRLPGYFGESADIERNAIKLIQFTDGTQWTREQILPMLKEASNGPDELYGDASDNVLSALAGADVVYGYAGNDTLAGNEGYDTLYGGLGNDSLTGDDGNDLVQGDAGNDSVNGNEGNDWLYGDDDDDFVAGGNGNDSLYGGEGDDTLVGGAGDDEMQGGSGHDVYEGGLGADYINSYGAQSAVFVYGLGDGSDEIADSSSSGTLSFRPGLTPADIALYQVVNEYDPTYGINDLVIKIRPTGDEIRVVRGLGVSIHGEPASGAIEFIRFSDGTTWNSAAINARILNLNAAPTTLVGTSGNDSYVIDHPLDVIHDSFNGAGVDTVLAGINYRLPAAIENLTLTGDLHINGSGNDQPNIITGNAGNNRLSGVYSLAFPSTSDTLRGGAGDDTYVLSFLENAPGYSGFYVYHFSQVEGVYTQVIELANEGIDTVKTDFPRLTLSSNVENIVVSGFALQSIENSVTGIDVRPRYSGNTQNNMIDASILYSNPFGDIVLDGGSGADTLIGGDANNYYVVDNLGDVIQERGVDIAGSQTSLRDTIATPFATDLRNTNLENIQLTGNQAVNAIGNERGNSLSGADNAAANVLTGGAGDDIYRLGAGDTAVELAGEGTDTIVFSGAPGSNRVAVFDTAAYANFEVFQLSEQTRGSTLVGTARDDVFTGVSGGEVLDGGAGNDRLVDADANVNGGLDNAADRLIGGEGNDILISASGNDTLSGGSGNDTMTGGSGANRFLLSRGFGSDIIDQRLADAYVDTIEFDATVSEADVQMELLATNASGGRDLCISLAGTADSVLVRGFSTTIGSRTGAVDEIRFADGVIWSHTDMVARLTGVQGSSGDDTMTATAEGSFLFGNGGDDSLVGAAGVDYLYGGQGSDTLRGATGNDMLDGGAGADALAGGAGDDVYVVDTAADTVTELAGEGTADEVRSSTSWTLGANLENLTLTGSAALTGTGNGLINIIRGNDGDNVLDGGGGADRLYGGRGNDTYLVDTQGETLGAEQADGGVDTVRAGINYVLDEGEYVENLVLTGTAAINGTGNWLGNRLEGNAAINTLSGLDGNDWIDGGGGADKLIGGYGDDTYVVDNTADAITELASAGNDTVRVSLTYTLAANLENLVLTGTAAINGTGNGDANRLEGNANDNTLSGGAGADTLLGGAGNDVYVVDNLGDVVAELASEGVDTVQSSVAYTLGSHVEHLTLTGTATAGAGNDLANLLIGNASNNTLGGGAGNDTLDGGAGNDTMAGGLGDDSYVVSASTDVVTEAAGEGIDTVSSAVTFALSATSQVENLTLTGTGKVNATGNDLNNVLLGNSGINILTGNGGNDTLDGGAGADSLVGGAGDDRYVVDLSTDIVTEGANAGVDTVVSTATFMLSANVENLVLLGNTAINGTGNADANRLEGNSGANVLNGAAGADTMIGGAGSDSYVVDSVGDIVTELANEGTDLVTSSVDYALGANLENLTLSGTTAINGTGNALANVLTGNSAANVLTGGAGNDTYVVGTGDTVIEQAGEGTDLVQAGITWSIASAAHVEDLTLTGTSAINGTGNTLNNVLTGNTANNRLEGGAGDDVIDGGSGNDTMVGGTGNDSYTVNVSTDVVTENADEGTDTVNSSVTLTTLAANVEHLTLTGTTAINGTGNTADNVLTGNSAANTLQGLAGNDRYVGGAGNDILTDNSTTSNDVYVWGTGQGSDTVTDAGGADRIEMLAGVTSTQVTLTRATNDLRVGITGSTDTLLIKNWYTNTASQIEEIRFADGSTMALGGVAPLAKTSQTTRSGVSGIKLTNGALATALLGAGVESGVDNIAVPEQGVPRWRAGALAPLGVATSGAEGAMQARSFTRWASVLQEGFAAVPIETGASALLNDTVTDSGKGRLDQRSGAYGDKLLARQQPLDDLARWEVVALPLATVDNDAVPEPSLPRWRAGALAALGLAGSGAEGALQARSIARWDSLLPEGFAASPLQTAVSVLLGNTAHETGKHQLGERSGAYGDKLLAQQQALDDLTLWDAVASPLTDGGLMVWGASITPPPRAHDVQHHAHLLVQAMAGFAGHATVGDASPHDPFKNASRAGFDVMMGVPMA